MTDHGKVHLKHEQNEYAYTQYNHFYCTLQSQCLNMKYWQADLCKVDNKKEKELLIYAERSEFTAGASRQSFV